ncbi:MAG: hypothetical protein ABUT20_22570 [Bacteroidota bacterium]
MKYFLVFILSVACLCFCNVKAEKDKRKISSTAIPGSDSINYQTQIVPILEKKCTPCHFPGGKMYERMPFDKGETIISHETGVLKRIKDEDQVSLIKQFIAQNKKAVNL